MATAASRDIQLRMQVETLNTERIDALADDIKQLAAQSDKSGAEFDRLAESLQKIGAQTEAVDLYRKLNAELEKTRGTQTEAQQAQEKYAEKVQASAVALKAATDAQTRIREQVAATKTALVQADAELTKWNKSNDAAEKKTDAFRTKLAQLVDAQAVLKKELIEQSVAQREANKEVTVAEREQRKLAAQYDALDKSTKGVNANVAEASSKLREAANAAAAAGVDVGKLADEELRLQQALQTVSNEAVELQATLKALQELDRQATVAKAALEAQMDRIANAYKVEAEAAERAAKAAAELAAAQKEAARVELAEHNRLAAVQATAMAEAYARAQVELRQLNAAEREAEALARSLQAQDEARKKSALDYVLALEAEEEQIKRLIETERKRVADLDADLQRKQRVDALTEAFSQLDVEVEKVGASFKGLSVRSFDQIQAEIDATERSMAELAARAKSGAISTAEFYRETQASSVALRELRGELAGLAPQANAVGDAFERLNIRSIGEIQKDITATETAVATLAARVQSGEISLEEFERAALAAGAATQKLRREMDEVPRAASGFAQLSNRVNHLFMQMSGLAAAFATVALAAQPVIETVVGMQRLERVLTAMSGSAEMAARQIEFLRNVSNTAGIQFDKVTDSYSKFVTSVTASGIELSVVNATFEATARAAGVLGLSADRVTLILDAMSQMASKGVVSMEELRQQLGDSLPGAMSLTAKGLGITEQQLIKLVESGELAAKDVLPALGQAMTELADKGGEIDGLAAQWNRFMNTVKEGIAVFSEGAFGDIIGRALTGLHVAFNLVATAAVGASEAFTIFYNILGLINDRANGSISSFSELGTKIRETVEQSAARMSAFSERIDKVNESLTGSSDKAKQMGDAVAASTPKIEANAAAQGKVGENIAAAGEKAAQAAPKHEQAAQAQETSAKAAVGLADASTKAGVAVETSSQAAQGATVSWVKLQAAYEESQAKLEDQSRGFAKASDAAKKFGDTLVKTAELTGNETLIKQAGIKASEDFTAALDKEASAAAQLAEQTKIYIAQQEAVAKAEADGGESRRKAIEELREKSEVQQAAADKARSAAEAAAFFTAQLQIESEKLADNSARLDELKGSLEEARDGVERVALAMAQGGANSTDYSAAQIEVSRAIALVNDALADLEVKQEQTNAKRTATNELTIQAIETRKQEQAVIEAAADRLGNEIQAREALSNQITLEIEQRKLKIQEVVQEATEELALVERLRNEESALGQLTPAKKAEYDLRTLLAKQKLEEARTSGEVVRGMESEREAINGLQSAWQRLGVDIKQSSAGAAQSAISDYSKIRESGEGTTVQIREAFMSMAKAVLEANGGILDDWIKVEAGALGVSDKINQMAESISESFNAATKDAMAFTVALDKAADRWEKYTKSTLTYDKDGFATVNGQRLVSEGQVDIPDGMIFDAEKFRREADFAARAGRVAPDPSDPRFLRYASVRSGAAPTPAPSPTPTPTPAPAPTRETTSSVRSPSPAPAPAPAPAPSQVVELRLNIGGNNVSVQTDQARALAIMQAVENARRSSGLNSPYQ